MGVAVGINETKFSPNLSEAGEIPARILGDRALTLDAGHPWKLAVGFRPVRVVGAEIQYLHLGEGDTYVRRGSQVPSQYAAIRASSEATVMSALLFIPERIPETDFYAKVGIAELDESLKASGYDSLGPGGQPAIPNCAFDSSVENSDTMVPYVGFGARIRVGRAAAVRVEFEAMDGDLMDNTTMISLGIAWEH